MSKVHKPSARPLLVKMCLEHRCGFTSTRCPDCKHESDLLKRYADRVTAQLLAARKSG